MAHEISLAVDGNNETAEALFAGVSAWHGLGQTLDVVTLKDVYDMLPAVEKSPLTANYSMPSLDGNGEPIIIPITTHSAMVRTDNMRPVGIVGNDYQPYQYSQLVTDFVAPMIDDNAATIETAILLSGGARCNVLLKLNGEDLQLDDDNDKDTMQPYILVRSGHDGITKVSLRATGVRVVCANTEAMAVRCKALASTRHTAKMGVRIADIQHSLADTYKAFQSYAKSMRSLHMLKATTDDVKAFAFSQFDYDPSAEDTRGRTRAYNNVKAYLRVYNKGQTDGRVKGETWGGIYNAFTDYLDHNENSGRDTGDGDAQRMKENRFNSIVNEGGTIALKRSKAQDYVNAKTGIDLIAV